MKSKSYFQKVFLLVACIAMLATGCKKLYDYIYSHGDGDYKACNIKRIDAIYYSPFKGSPPDTTTYKFTYNALGNPVSVINNHVGTGNGNYFFTYDKYNRLREFLSLYSNGGYEQWQRYGYNNKGQIVRDTSYIFGAAPGGVPLPSEFYTYIDFEYDAHGRISFERDSSFIQGHFSNVGTQTYAYDARGNRLIPGASLVYDDKLNLNRTNSVWMFILRDYSVNNPFTATRYNASGLPLVFDYNIQLIGSAGTDTRVDYMCH